MKLPDREIMLSFDFMKKNSSKKQESSYPLDKQYELQNLLIREEGFESLIPSYYRNGIELWVIKAALDL